MPDEIDLTNCDAAAAVLLGARDDRGLVIADMTRTTFCDSSGIRMLIVTRGRLEASGSALRIVIKPGGSVARSMAVLGVEQILPIYTHVQDAVQAQPETTQPPQ